MWTRANLIATVQAARRANHTYISLKIQGFPFYANQAKMTRIMAMQCARNVKRNIKGE